MKLFETTVLAASDTVQGTPAGDAATSRAGIMEMTQTAEAAVLAPRDVGAWPHELRAALAARVARLNGDEALAARYLDRAGDRANLADPAADGAAEGLGPVLEFVDKVAARTAQVTAEDVTALQGAGVPDADIVRLAELNAYLAYQIRVVAGLRLLQGGTA